MPQSDLKSFAFLWAFVCTAVGLYPLINGEGIWAPPLIIAGGFLFVGLMFPYWLAGFYNIWMKFAKIIGFVNTTIIMSLLFYFIFAPIAFLLRLLNKDFLNKRLDRTRKTYWMKRESQPTSMKLQF